MERIRLEDACDILNGFAFKSDKYVENGIRIIRIANVQKGYIDENAPAFYPIDSVGLEKYMLEEDDLLMSLTGNVGRVALLQKEMLPAALNQRVACLRLKVDRITKGFLFHILNSDFFEQQCVQASNGVAQKNISTEWLKDYEIPLYSIEKQLKITDVFDKVRRIIISRNDELSTLDNLIKARFVEMFDLSNCVYKSLGECTDFVDYRGHTPELSDEGTIRMINAKSVGKGFFKYVDEFITEKTYESWMHRGFGYPGDILFVTEGHTFGNACLIPKDMTKFALGQRVITIKGKDEIKNAFLCSYMQTDMFGKDINAYRTGGTAQGIRSKDLVKVMVPIPPIEQQKDFVKFVNQVDKSKFKEKSCYIKYKILKIRHRQIYLLRK